MYLVYASPQILRPIPQSQRWPTQISNLARIHKVDTTQLWGFVRYMAGIFLFVCFLTTLSVSLRVSAPPRSYENSQQQTCLLSFFFFFSQLAVVELRSPTVSLWKRCLFYSCGGTKVILRVMTSAQYLLLHFRSAR